MKHFLLPVIGCLFLAGFPLRAEWESALSVTIAKKTLMQVMRGIAQEIDSIRGDFPQLRKWHKAHIRTNRIEYLKDGRNRCYLLIYSKEKEEFPHLKVGVYLKLQAEGERAQALKAILQKIITKHFEKIRALRFAASVE